MSHNQKVIVLLGVTLGTVILLFGTRGITSVFSFWPDK